MSLSKEEMLESIVGSLIGRYNVSEETAREAAHEGYLRSVGRPDDQEAFQHYWYVSSRNYMVSSFKKEARYVRLQPHQMRDKEQTNMKEEEEEESDTSEILDYCEEKLEGKDRKLFHLLRTGYDHKEISQIFNTTTGNIRIMKHRLIKALLASMLLLLVPMFAVGQDIELVRPADFRYYVTVDGDTLSSRTLEYKAIQDAINYKAMYPNMLIRVEPSGIEIRGSLPEVIIEDIQYVEIVDTVYVENEVFITDTLYVDRIDTVYTEVTIRDTVYVETADTIYSPYVVYEDLIRSVDWEHRQTELDKHYINLTVDSDAETSYLIEACGFSWTQNEAITCSEMAYISVTATEGNRTVTVRDSVDLAFMNQIFMEEQAFLWNDPSLWTPYWNDNASLTSDSTGITHSKLERGSDVQILEQEGMFTFLDVRAKISAGLHLRMLSSPLGSSQDVYIAGDNVRYVRWLEGDPGSTSMYDELVLVPFEEQEGLVSVRFQVGQDSVRVKAWYGDYSEEPEDWMLEAEADEARPGYIGFGSHSISDRRIEDLEVIDSLSYQEEL